ncbi:MAG: hypothetical protein HYT80_08730 [Euryarchaeota archaeon]|nr:hypothetical protein [Euryarchaeota archaeon]
MGRGSPLRAILVTAAWFWFLLAPFLLSGLEEGVESYGEGLVSAVLLWAPMLVATVFTFVGPRLGGIISAGIFLAIPVLMVLTYGSGLGLLVIPSGVALVFANVVKAKEQPSPPEGPPAAPLPPLRRT